MHVELATPAPLRPGDKIRFVSPASTPNREAVEASAELLRSWGFEVDFGPNAFRKLHYLAGTDEERLSDFNQALRDPEVRAIFATRGGKGSYRIADRLDFEAAKRNPKFFVGFSDVTILHMALWKNGIGGGIHGALSSDDWEAQGSSIGTPLRELLTSNDDIVLRSQAEEETFALTTEGKAEGPLVGGNLDSIATAAGWALPNLEGCILLLEAVDMYLGQVDRQLTMLRKGGHLRGVAGIALGQFTDFKPSGALTIVDLLRDHLAPLNVPILGGLPLGHGKSSQRIPLGCHTVLDANQREIRVFRRDLISLLDNPQRIAQTRR
ncbi:LD-carboxypeptidase [Microvirga sp. 3-52]|nr:LD-carboxypeptidase [Microvirga sp. 3-52]MBS7455299.1 LD-carboxypeptidase [Microvirga sp. 3-52]